LYKKSCTAQKKSGVWTLSNPAFHCLSACTGGETRTPGTWFWRPVLQSWKSIKYK